ncbi:MAG: FHA domain-containing protein [Rhodomicrobium sp.]
MTKGPHNDPSNAETVSNRPGGTAGRRSDGSFVDPQATVLIQGGAAPYSDDPKTRVIRPDQAPNTGSTPASSNRPASNIDPVVGLLVVIGGPGKGSYRGLFYGNNSMGRSADERVPLDFGDDAISHSGQACIRYDLKGRREDRRFLLIPDLTKSNIVYVNDQAPTAPVAINYGDIISIGQTRLRFFPICGHEFDWSDVVDQ